MTDAFEKIMLAYLGNPAVDHPRDVYEDEDQYEREAECVKRAIAAQSARIAELERERDAALAQAFPRDMFDPSRRAVESYKDLWEAALELAAEDMKECFRIRDDLESRLTSATHALRVGEAAGNTLQNNLVGSLTAFEHEIRDAIGNTNYRCIMDGAKEFYAALATIRAALEGK